MIGCADAILAAVRREIEQRRAMIDAAGDLGEVSVRIRLQAGTVAIRSVLWEEERIYRRAVPLSKDAHDSIRT